jgi:hypothetical protein
MLKLMMRDERYVRRTRQSMLPCRHFAGYLANKTLCSNTYKVVFLVIVKW